jgi:hypothetical protein
MGLKKIIDMVHAPVPTGPVESIGDALWKFLSEQGATSDTSREPGYHPSGLYYFCPRKDILSRVFPKPEADYKPPEMQMVFDWGTAWHWFVQNHYFGPMGLLWGSWKCNRCERTVHETFMPEPCEKCHHWKAGAVKRGGFWTYIEPKVFNKEWKIPGHADGILILSKDPAGAKSLLEVKTINADDFKKLSGPKPEHAFQVNLYLWLLGLDECWITYWTKDAKQTKPKVFQIKFDPAVPEETKRRIAFHREALKSGELCAGICPNDQCRSAIYCPWRSECYRSDIEAMVKHRGIPK